MRILSLLMVVLFAGCAGRQIIPENTTIFEKISSPEIGEVTVAGIGERLVAKGTRKTGHALELIDSVQFNKEDGEASIMTCALSVNKGIYFQSGKYKGSSDICFGPVIAYISESDGSSSFNCNNIRSIPGDICKINNGPYYLAAMAHKYDLEQDFNKFDLGKKTADSDDNYIQEFIYNGRVGNEIRFVYREFINDIIRPAFSQTVQYDLSESNIVGFKNLRLKVINATNTIIKYELDRNF